MESKAILRGIDGSEITRYGTTMMLVQFGDRTFKIRFEVVNCHNPLLSVSEMENHGFTVHLADGERYVQRKSVYLELERHRGLCLQLGRRLEYAHR